MKMKLNQCLLLVTGLTASLNAAQMTAPSTPPQAISATQQPKATKADGTPLDVKLELTKGGTTTLADLMEGNKAILLDFWATYCGPCMKSMPGLKHKAEVLAPQGVAVVAINTDNKNKAEKIRIERQIDFPWLAETDHFYTKYFQINSIPRAILISAEGKVLFNGHPENIEALQMALNKLGVKL